MSDDRLLTHIRLTLEQEAAAIIQCAHHHLDERKLKYTVKILSEAQKVVVSGMGKMGHVGLRFAATLSSTGTPAVFLHPAEAAHGDIGIICKGDALFALSNSGKTREVLEMVAGARNLVPSLPVIVATGNSVSSLARISTVLLCYGKIKEPCPLGLTPTASVAVMSALLDAIALCVMAGKGFTAEAYSQRHHSGYLGQKARAEARLQYGLKLTRLRPHPGE